MDGQPGQPIRVCIDQPNVHKSKSTSTPPPQKNQVDQIYHLACPASPPHYQYNPIKVLPLVSLWMWGCLVGVLRVSCGCGCGCMCGCMHAGRPALLFPVMIPGHPHTYTHSSTHPHPPLPSKQTRQSAPQTDTAIHPFIPPHPSFHPPKNQTIKYNIHIHPPIHPPITPPPPKKNRRSRPRRWAPSTCSGLPSASRPASSSPPPPRYGPGPAACCCC